jgi:hypothetical protein
VVILRRKRSLTLGHLYSFDGQLDGPPPLCISEDHTINPKDVDRSIELDGYYPCDEDCPRNPEPDTGRKSKKAKKA